jgi:hypothetical protein
MAVGDSIPMWLTRISTTCWPGQFESQPWASMVSGPQKLSVGSTNEVWARYRSVAACYRGFTVSGIPVQRYPRVIRDFDRDPSEPRGR